MYLDLSRGNVNKSPPPLKGEGVGGGVNRGVEVSYPPQGRIGKFDSRDRRGHFFAKSAPSSKKQHTMLFFRLHPLKMAWRKSVSPPAGGDQRTPSSGLLPAFFGKKAGAKKLIRLGLWMPVAGVQCLPLGVAGGRSPLQHSPLPAGGEGVGGGVLKKVLEKILALCYNRTEIIRRR